MSTSPYRQFSLQSAQDPNIKRLFLQNNLISNIPYEILEMTNFKNMEQIRIDNNIIHSSRICREHKGNKNNPKYLEKLNKIEGLNIFSRLRH